jgi:ubiquinone/menaquinone biosynthesis C-methylase UbiE
MTPERDHRSNHVERQSRFYGTGAHAHLQSRADDHYAAKLAARLARGLDMKAGDRVLEVGAGFGRFTFPLLSHCASVVALDLSERMLASLERVRDERGIPEARCRLVCGDVDALDEASVEAPFDHVVGFFFLHHLDDQARTLQRLARWIAPSGGIGFVEPNRRNPLFALQVLACPDMSWREERGMFRLTGAAVEAAYRSAGLNDIRSETFGFFPPQIVNHLATARRLEERLEALRSLRWILPFLLLSARRPQPDGEPS